MQTPTPSAALPLVPLEPDDPVSALEPLRGVHASVRMPTLDDLRAEVRRHPLAWLAGAVLFGALLGGGRPLRRARSR